MYAYSISVHPNTTNLQMYIFQTVTSYLDNYKYNIWQNLFGCLTIAEFVFNNEDDDINIIPINLINFSNLTEPFPKTIAALYEFLNAPIYILLNISKYSMELFSNIHQIAFTKDYQP